MLVEKLKEALSEVNTQRNALDSVEAQLRSMIATLSAGGTTSLPRIVTPGRERERDQIDEVADVLRAHGSPLHISEIAARMSALREQRIDRTQIEPGLNRHISKVKTRRVDKFGPSTYGLPEWKNDQQPTLVQIA